MICRIYKTLVFLCFLFILFGEGYSQTLDVRTLEGNIDQGMQEWNIPGLAIAVVKDDKIVYSKGFGKKKLGSEGVVDEYTLFGIASVSKNITAAALALLVDEGKLKWDDRVVDIIPWFQLQDPWVTREVRVVDLLTHKVGLGRILGNRLQFMTQSSRDEIIQRVKYMELEKPFRSSFVYSNMMYSLAGQLIEYIEGVSWDEFLKNRVFALTGMHTANTSILDFLETDNVAWPHQEIEGEVIAIPRRNWDNAGPAGGINASVMDVAQWMRMQLGEPGVYEGKRVISQKQMHEMHRPHSIRGQSDTYGSIMAYGLGWNISDYEGYRVLSHGGATDGFNTAAYMVPKINLGVVVVGNTFNTLGDALAYSIIDDYLGIADKSWPARYRNNYVRAYDQAKSRRNEIHAARHADTSPSLMITDYIGKYEHDAYGKVEVLEENGQLKLCFWDDQNLIADLEHWHYDTFRAVWQNKAQREEFLSFQLDKSGKVKSLNFEFVLRPRLLQVGAYPSDYTKEVSFVKLD